MSKSRKLKRSPNSPVRKVAGRQFPRPAAVVLALAVLVAGGFWWSKVRHPDAPPVVTPAVTPTGTNSPAATAATKPEFQKLKGKWVRPDGGYIVEVRGIEPDGKLDVGYFNPRPINVSKAVALQDGPVVKVFIELRDVNYPGSTYTLAYEQGNDRLSGVYYQAALQQQFEVVFERSE